MAALGVLLAMSFPAYAQTTASKIELAGTYAYMRTNINGPGGYSEGLQTNGGTGSVTYNVNNSWGVVAEVGGYNSSTISSAGGNDISFASYLFGPRYSFRKWDTLTPYVQTLFGGVKGNHALTVGANGVSGQFQADKNAFAWTIGGGMDAKVTNYLAVRVFQAEYFMTRWDNGGTNQQNNFRIETGLVFRFGKR
ncbi:MAG: outer membrane beta-barrel protein [Acidobacteriota bacterium]|nr:outer membrane beta-barrel protein [Acidobacteriota bacterium]